MPPRWLLAGDPSAQRRRDTGRPVSPGDVDRAAARARELEALMVEAGGIAGPGTLGEPEAAAQTDGQGS